jgi:hypothetical protein
MMAAVGREERSVSTESHGLYWLNFASSPRPSVFGAASRSGRQVCEWRLGPSRGGT